MFQQAGIRWYQQVQGLDPSQLRVHAWIAPGHHHSTFSQAARGRSYANPCLAQPPK
jgi:hypothetical protein